MPYFFGINVGAGVNGGATGILEQATTTSRDVEIAINTNANVPDRAQLLACIQALESYIAGKAGKNW
jgi:hypothetical protein